MQYEVNGIGSTGFCGVVGKDSRAGQWNAYIDICSVSVPWDDIEHIRPRMLITWNVIGHNYNSQNADIVHDCDLDLALNGRSFYQ